MNPSPHFIAFAIVTVLALLALSKFFILRYSFSLNLCHWRVGLHFRDLARPRLTGVSIFRRHNYASVFISALLVGALFSGGCSWVNSTNGKATLTTLAGVASAVEPQYAGVIGLGLYGLETAAGQPTVAPSTAQIQSAITSVTGGTQKPSTVSALAAAVSNTVKVAPSPNAGLSQSAATINAVAAPALSSQVNVQFQGHMPDAPPLVPQYLPALFRPEPAPEGEADFVI